jgi:carnitine O-acetyltransferase
MTRIEPVYEPAMTKTFLHGRTEAIRSVTKESSELVRTFWADNPAQQKIDALRAACQKHVNMTKECSKAQGFDRHMYALYCVWQRKVNEEGAEAASSTGFSSNGYSSPADPSDPGSPSRLDDVASTNRSRAATDASTSRSPGPALQQHMPVLFSDAGWERINNTVLSTSNCGNPALRHFGFGPVSADGFGIGYIIKEDSISICASSKHRQTKRYIESIETYFNEMRRLLKANKGKDVPGTKHSRAREAEDKIGKDGRLKSRGRVIKTEASKNDPDGRGMQTPTSIDTNEVEDDGLGGCKLLTWIPHAREHSNKHDRWLFRCGHAAAGTQEKKRAATCRADRATTQGGGQEAGS